MRHRHKSFLLKKSVAHVIIWDIDIEFNFWKNLLDGNRNLRHWRRSFFKKKIFYSREFIIWYINVVFLWKKIYNTEFIIQDVDVEVFSLKSLQHKIYNLRNWRRSYSWEKILQRRIYTLKHWRRSVFIKTKILEHKIHNFRHRHT